MKGNKMKKILATLLAVSMTAGIVNAQQVLSRNAVGYVKVDIESNKLYLITVPFENMNSGDGSFLLTNVLAVVPGGTGVSVWDEPNQTYNTFSRSGRGVWDLTAQTATIVRGQALFIRMPSTSSPTNLFLMGEVPDQDTSQERVNSGLTFLGYPFPASVSFTGSALAVNTPDGSGVSKWDPAANTYVTYSKSGRGVWDLSAQAAVIEPGQAFIIRSSAAPSSWVEVKPYTWP
jgi:hypothetical protein